MKIHHIGYAVKTLDKATGTFENLGFRFGPRIDDAKRNVQIAFGENQNCRIELVAPLDKSHKSPADAYLSRIGPTPYHFCYECADIERAIAELKESGFHTVLPPEPAIAFNGKRVAFLINRNAGLIELAETPPSAGEYNA